MDVSLAAAPAALANLASVVAAFPADTPGWVQTMGDHMATIHVDRDVDSEVDADEAFDAIVARFHELHVGGDERGEGDPGYMPGFRHWVAGASVGGWALSVVVRSRP